MLSTKSRSPEQGIHRFACTSTVRASIADYFKPLKILQIQNLARNLL
jgi:hypothetical protein